MYYYYYYNTEIKLNFTFENKMSNLTEKISIVEFERLLKCLNLINQCAVESATLDIESKINGDDYNLRLDKISYNSPLDLTVIVPIAASVVGIPYLILQSIEKILNLKIDHQKKKLELEKLKLDKNEKSKDRVAISDSDIDKKLTTMISSELFERISKEMKTLPFEIIGYEVRYNIKNLNEEKE